MTLGELLDRHEGDYIGSVRIVDGVAAFADGGYFDVSGASFGRTRIAVFGEPPLQLDVAARFARDTGLCMGATRLRVDDLPRMIANVHALAVMLRQSLDALDGEAD